MAENVGFNNSIYQLFRKGEFEKAENSVLDYMGSNEGFSQSGELEKLLKISRFWESRKSYFEYSEDNNNGEELFDEWDKFIDFCHENKIDNWKSVLAVKEHVFTRMIDMLIDAYQLSPVKNWEILIILGQAFYEIGLVDRAIETLEYYLKIAQENTDVRGYLLLANLYAEVGENNLAMAFFNELFYRFPQEFQLDKIDFPPLTKVRILAEEDGIKSTDLSEWMPVYAYLFEALTVKGRINFEKYQEIKEKIIGYEKKIALDKNMEHILIPRLMNLYLWILDYYLFQAEVLNPANSVMNRFLELLDLSELSAEVKEKLSIRSEALFHQMADKVSQRNTEEENRDEQEPENHETDRKSIGEEAAE